MATRKATTTSIQLYGTPTFAVVTHKHTEGAWVHALDDNLQDDFWQIASDAKDNGQALEFEYERYTDEPGARRYYFGVQNLHKI